jgi:GntR family histidine utilization transcriptional repressor
MTAQPLSLALSGDQSVPMYQQIKDAIRQKIRSGDWASGQMIPSENQLADGLGISRMTINRPLRELTAEGLLRRVHGLGTFVAEPARQAHLLELVSIAEEIKQQGKIYRAEVLHVTTVKANAELSARMQLVPGSKLFSVEVVHYQDDTAIQLEYRYVNPILVPDFLEVDFSTTTPSEYLISQILPDEIEHVVQAVMPDDFMTQHLDIPATEPCLKLRRRTWKAGEVVTTADMIYPSSRYDLGARYTPNSNT